MPSARRAFTGKVTRPCLFTVTNVFDMGLTLARDVTMCQIVRRGALYLLRLCAYARVSAFSTSASAVRPSRGYEATPHEREGILIVPP